MRRRDLPIKTTLPSGLQGSILCPDAGMWDWGTKDTLTVRAVFGPVAMPMPTLGDKVTLVLPDGNRCELTTQKVYADGTSVAVPVEET